MVSRTITGDGRLQASIVKPSGSGRDTRGGDRSDCGKMKTEMGRWVEDVDGEEGDTVGRSVCM